MFFTPIYDFYSWGLRSGSLRKYINCQIQESGKLKLWVDDTYEKQNQRVGDMCVCVCVCVYISIDIYPYTYIYIYIYKHVEKKKNVIKIWRWYLNNSCSVTQYNRPGNLIAPSALDLMACGEGGSINFIPCVSKSWILKCISTLTISLYDSLREHEWYILIICL